MTRADLVTAIVILIAAGWLCSGVAIFPAKRQP